MSELEPRASGAERERTVARLREASTEGRLTLEELADRTALAYAARSHGELARSRPGTSPSASSSRSATSR